MTTVPSSRDSGPWPALGLATAAVYTGLELGIRLAAEAAGLWGVLAASVMFPATIAGAPLLALTWGQWVSGGGGVRGRYSPAASSTHGTASGTSCPRTPLLHLDVEQLELVDQGGVWRNGSRHPPGAVSEVGRNDQAALAAYSHSGDALLPAGDHVAPGTELKLRASPPSRVLSNCSPLGSQPV